VSGLLLPAIACGLAVSAEALFMGRQGPAFLKSLRQPRFAPKMWVWSLIGLAYYAACFFGIYRMLRMRPPFWRLALGLILVVLTANAAWNYVFFRLRDLRLSFWFGVPYALVVGGLLVVMAIADTRSAIAMGAYGAYLPYATWFSYQTWKLNPTR
jgi:tryptophan-rich sensory protein